MTDEQIKNIVREFDDWFNHGTKEKPHGLLSSDYYKEVRNFLTQSLQNYGEKVGEEENKKFINLLQLLKVTDKPKINEFITSLTKQGKGQR